jgi:methionine-rich copper-binding protein CopC
MVNHRVIVAAAVLGDAVTLAAPTVQAHAFLDHASPAVGSTVPTAPETVTMWFTQELEPAFTTATVTDASGNTVDAGPAQIDPKDPTELRVALRKLSPGTYTVSWHALSVDTHTTTGHFTFEIKP